MSYTPTTWVTGDTITAVKLNNMEQGIADAGGGTAIVGYSFDIETNRTTCNKTAEEIYELFISNGSVALMDTDDDYSCVYQIVQYMYENYDPQDFYFSMHIVNSGGSIISFIANSANDYPYTTSAI